jgi:hypothetical protein
MKRADRFNVAIAAILLTLEMMADNFAGLSRHLPNECRDARDKLDRYLPNAKTRLMDLYFPRRDEVGTQEFEVLLTQLFQEGAPSPDTSNGGLKNVR